MGCLQIVFIIFKSTSQPFLTQHKHFLVAKEKNLASVISINRSGHYGHPHRYKKCFSCIVFPHGEPNAAKFQLFTLLSPSITRNRPLPLLSSALNNKKYLFCVFMPLRLMFLSPETSALSSPSGSVHCLYLSFI